VNPDRDDQGDSLRRSRRGSVSVSQRRSSASAVVGIAVRVLGFAIPMVFTVRYVAIAHARTQSAMSKLS
jgi:hypothetical protein